MTSWASMFADGDQAMQYLEQVTDQGWEPRAELMHVLRGLEGWTGRLAEQRRWLDQPGPIQMTQRYYWAASTLSTVAHDYISEALGSVDIDKYGPDTERPIACAHRVVTQVVKAWRAVLTDVIRLRDTGQLGSDQAWESVVEQACDVIEMARNASLAAYR